KLSICSSAGPLVGADALGRGRMIADPRPATRDPRSRQLAQAPTISSGPQARAVVGEGVAVRRMIVTERRALASLAQWLGADVTPGGAAWARVFWWPVPPAPAGRPRRGRPPSSGWR